MQIELPIYYTFSYKRKADKTILLSMNFYRNAHYHSQNTIKKYIHELVEEQVGNFTSVDQFTLDIDIYYKNAASDGSNVAALLEKFCLDGLQECKVIPNDNVKYHLGTTWRVAGQDKDNPRCIVTIHPAKKEI